MEVLTNVQKTSVKTIKGSQNIGGRPKAAQADVKEIIDRRA